MKGLLIKDLRLMIRQKRFFFMMLMMSFIFMISMDNPSFIVGYFTLICSFFSISTISYDEINHGYAFLFTLPICKKQYVCSKYLFAMIISLLSWIISMIIAFIYQILSSSIIYSLDDFMSNFLIFLTAIITLSIMLPIKLKFGAEKGNIVQLLIFGIIFVGGILFSKLILIDINVVIQFIEQLSSLLIAVVTLITTLIILFISYHISLQIMYKKEF